MSNILNRASLKLVLRFFPSFHPQAALVKAGFVGLLMAVFIILLLSQPALSQAARIFMDGEFGDWQSLPPIYADSIGDQTSGDIDFGRLWVANDERFLFLCFEVGTEINLQSYNDITLFLDTDNNPATGKQIHGIGAELEWNFGEKTGFFVSAVDSLSIYQVQYTTDQGAGNDCYPSPWSGQTVTISGIVTAVKSGDDPYFWLQDGGTPWSGIFFYDTSVDPGVGDSLTVTAQIDEYHGRTEAKDISNLKIHRHSCPYDTIDISTGDLGAGCSFSGEAYEGCLVRVRNVRVTQLPDQYNQWWVDDGSGECQIDENCYPLQFDPNWQDTCLSITGVVDYSWGEYEIDPRGAGDIVETSCNLFQSNSPKRGALPIGLSSLRNIPHPLSQSIPISHSDIGLVAAPTVTSTQFEVAIDRYAQPVNGKTLFPGDTIRVVFADTVGGDLLPDTGMGLTYTFDNTPLPPLPSLSIGRADTGYFRVLTYNVLSDGIFDSWRQEYFERILKAVNPDIIGFEEIYDHNAEETAAQVESILPSTGGGQWYGSKVNPDVIAVGRYPIIATHPIDGFGNGAFLIDLHPKYDKELLFIVAHLPCCERDSDRQLEADALMAFIRDAKAESGDLDLQPNTPIIVVGDMNLVGDRQQLRTLLRGEIINTGLYGPPFAPDWDGTDFADLMPRQPDLPMTYTWYSGSNGSNWPGRLDFIIYSNSVIDSGNHYVLFTTEMSSDSLAAHGLQPEDALWASDHLPVVGDFRLSESPGTQANDDFLLPKSFSLEQNYPNPFNATTLIRYRLSAVGRPRSAVKLEVYNIFGEKVATLVDGRQEPGRYSVSWKADNLGSGIYFYMLRAGGFSQTRRCVILK